MRTFLRAMILSLVFPSLISAKDAIKVDLRGESVTIPSPSGFVVARNAAYNKFQNIFGYKYKVLGIFVPSYLCTTSDMRSISKFCVVMQPDIFVRKCKAKSFDGFCKFVQKDMRKRHGHFQRGIYRSLRKHNRSARRGNYLTVSDIKFTDVIRGDDYFSVAWKYRVENSKNGQSVELRGGLAYCNVNGTILLANMLFKDYIVLDYINKDMAQWASEIVKVNKSGKAHSSSSHSKSSILGKEAKEILSSTKIAEISGSLLVTFVILWLIIKNPVLWGKKKKRSAAGNTEAYTMDNQEQPPPIPPM